MKKYFKPVIKPHKLKGMTILAGSNNFDVSTASVKEGDNNVWEEE